MKEAMNKKGQITWNQILPLLIGLAVVFIIVYFWYGLGEAGEDITGAIPDAVASKAQVCKSAYAPIENVVGWCNPSKIDDNEYMNCKYIQTTYDSTLGEGFDPTCVDSIEKTFCEQLKNSQGDKYDSEKIFVNGVNCVTHSG